MRTNVQHLVSVEDVLLSLERRFIPFYTSSSLSRLTRLQRYDARGELKRATHPKEKPWRDQGRRPQRRCELLRQSDAVRLEVMLSFCVVMLRDLVGHETQFPNSGRYDELGKLLGSTAGGSVPGAG